MSFAMMCQRPGALEGGDATEEEEPSILVYKEFDGGVQKQT